MKFDRQCVAASVDPPKQIAGKSAYGRIAVVLAKESRFARVSGSSVQTRRVVAAQFEEKSARVLSSGSCELALAAIHASSDLGKSWKPSVVQPG